MMKNKMIDVKIKKLQDDAKIPTYATEGSAGADLFSVDEVEISPGQTTLISCGFAIEIPPAYEAQIRPRSGLAKKHGLTVANSPGTIDCDYRGEVGVLLRNTGDTPYRVAKGSRVAQMVISPVMIGNFQVQSELSDTKRGSGGFGHSGV